MLWLHIKHVMLYKIISFKLFFGAVHDNSTPYAISFVLGFSLISGRAGIIKLIEIAIKSHVILKQLNQSCDSQ
jgi:hypothetical protein